MKIIPRFLKVNNYYLLKIFGLLFAFGIFLIIGWQTMDWFSPHPLGTALEMWVENI